MANVNATLAAARAAIPQTNVPNNQQGGDLQVFFATVTNPAAGGVAVGEYIEWGTLPPNARVVFGYLSQSAGAASSTLTLGDAASAARYLAATAVNAAGNTTIVPATNANGATGFVSSTETVLRSTCAGANLQASQTLTLVLFYVTNN